jgi:hypothetical protein
VSRSHIDFNALPVPLNLLRRCPATTEQPLELIIGMPGRLDSLHYRISEGRAPGPGEVEIRVRAAALNYKDILKAMGTIASQVLEDTYFGAAFRHGMFRCGFVDVLRSNPESPRSPKAQSIHGTLFERSPPCNCPAILSPESIKLICLHL